MYGLSDQRKGIFRTRVRADRQGSSRYSGRIPHYRTGVPSGPTQPLERVVLLGVEEGDGRGGQHRRQADVVVRHARDDRQGMAAGGTALAHPAAVALATIEQGEDLDGVSRREHVGVGRDEQRRDGDTAHLRAEVEVLGHRGADLVEERAEILWPRSDTLIELVHR